MNRATGSRSAGGFNYVSHGKATVLFVIALLIVMLPVAWTLLTLSWSYSEGERAGVLQKFSRKGWICKTSEGELAQYIVAGVAPQLWNFTVRDDKVADQLRAAVGAKVMLHYTEHRGVPTSCFGDTSYYVDAVTVLEPLVAAPAKANAASGAVAGAISSASSP